jgi:hypothetical protein
VNSGVVWSLPVTVCLQNLSDLSCQEPDEPRVTCFLYRHMRQVPTTRETYGNTSIKMLRGEAPRTRLQPNCDIESNPTPGTLKNMISVI